jgi:hypothetical protein
MGKGTDVFDIDKIQLQAAEINQAKQLGNVTSQAQLMAITNDLARLRVKKDILALEDAIASGDIKAIESATSKLNADLKILGALTGQELKLQDIESILEKLLPKNLINISNLEKAIALLKDLIIPTITPIIAAPVFLTPAAATGTSAANKLGTGTALTAEDLKVLSITDIKSTVPNLKGGGINAGDYAPTGFPGASGNSASVNITLTNNFGVVGDPNAAAELMDQVLVDAVQRGTLRDVFRS